MLSPCGFVVVLLMDYDKQMCRIVSQRTLAAIHVAPVLDASGWHLRHCADFRRCRCRSIEWQFVSVAFGLHAFQVNWEVAQRHRANVTGNPDPFSPSAELRVVLKFIGC